ncbi:MAG TPA: hypothetical protein VG457_10375, partial [Planctomycetota bacterium]|nr:hypothetical protein [Planctomycetota bacterium]
RELRPGRKILFSGPQGGYVLPEPVPAGSGFLHLCAGSGVAPNRGMIRSALARGGTDRHLLVLQNRTEADIFYREEWPDLVLRHRGRFKIRHALSRDAQEPVTIPLLQQEMADFLEGAAAIALVCGPNRPREAVLPDGSKRRQPGFCEYWGGNPRRKVGGHLEQLGLTPDRILMETW